MYSESLLYTTVIYEVAKIDMDEPIWPDTDTEFAGICYNTTGPTTIKHSDKVRFAKIQNFPRTLTFYLKLSGLHKFVIFF